MDDDLPQGPGIVGFLAGLLVIGILIVALYFFVSTARMPEGFTFSARCPKPAEFETLIVTINADAHGRLRGECSAVGGSLRGARR